MKACSLTATDEDGDEVHLMFILSVTADPMPTFAQSGTPIKAMDEPTYTLTTTDSNGDEVHLMFTLEVPDMMPTFGDTTIAAQPYLVNQEIASLTLPQATSGDEPLTYALPPELTFCF